MATKKSQRIGIWVIAIAMLVGTLGGFLAMILAPKNQQSDQARFDSLYAEYEKEAEAHQKKVTEKNDAIAADLSEKYFDTFNAYVSEKGSFEVDGITELATRDLREGEGEALDAESKFAMYYMGWNPEGKMFDSSFNEDETALGMPLIYQGNGSWDFGNGQLGGVIEGWTEGFKGMKPGGVRELTIPSDMAYGEQGGGDDIAPNTPIKFIIMAVEAPEMGEEITQPQMSEELKRLYSRIYNIDPNIFGGM